MNEKTVIHRRIDGPEFVGVLVRMTRAMRRRLNARARRRKLTTADHLRDLVTRDLDAASQSEPAR